MLQSIVDGWMRTGDLAEIDENVRSLCLPCALRHALRGWHGLPCCSVQGYCRIVGRSKDMIIRGGENIYPREIEDFLYTHPSVQDVQVVGVPDHHYGEEVCACIILRKDHTATVEEVCVARTGGGGACHCLPGLQRAAQQGVLGHCRV